MFSYVFAAKKKNANDVETFYMLKAVCISCARQVSFDLNQLAKAVKNEVEVIIKIYCVLLKILSIMNVHVFSLDSEISQKGYKWMGG